MGLDASDVYSQQFFPSGSQTICRRLEQTWRRSAEPQPIRKLRYVANIDVVE